jgi:hypothetical protein
MGFPGPVKANAPELADTVRDDVFVEPDRAAVATFAVVTVDAAVMLEPPAVVGTVVGSTVVGTTVGATVVSGTAVTGGVVTHGVAPQAGIVEVGTPEVVAMVGATGEPWGARLVMPVGALLLG